MLSQVSRRRCHVRCSGALPIPAARNIHPLRTGLVDAQNRKLSPLGAQTPRFSPGRTLGQVVLLPRPGSWLHDLHPHRRQHPSRSLMAQPAGTSSRLAPRLSCASQFFPSSRDARCFWAVWCRMGPVGSAPQTCFLLPWLLCCRASPPSGALPSKAAGYRQVQPARPPPLCRAQR